MQNMTDEFKLAPSILSADFSDLGSALKICDEGGAHWIHVDVMDNQFVPNLTIGPPVVKSLRPKTKKFLDVCREDLKLQIVGLMCIPPNEENVEKYFSRMLKIRNELSLDELSMGMSNDYLQAIKYEASFVRIGSKIFGKRSI